MRVQAADGRWMAPYEIERENGELTFLSKSQIEYLEYLDENDCRAGECWTYLQKARGELAQAEALLTSRWGRPQVVKGRIRAAKKLVALIQKRVVARVQWLDLDEVADVLSSDYDQDFKLLALEYLSELAAPVE